MKTTESAFLAIPWKCVWGGGMKRSKSSRQSHKRDEAMETSALPWQSYKGGWSDGRNLSLREPEKKSATDQSKEETLKVLPRASGEGVEQFRRPRCTNGSLKTVPTSVTNVLLLRSFRPF